MCMSLFACLSLITKLQYGTQGVENQGTVRYTVAGARLRYGMQKNFYRKSDMKMGYDMLVYLFSKLGTWKMILYTNFQPDSEPISQMNYNCHNCRNLPHVEDVLRSYYPNYTLSLQHHLLKNWMAVFYSNLTR